MEPLLSLLSQPITQIGAIIAVLMGLQKYGIDVKGAIAGGLGIKANNHEVDADNRNAMQTLLSSLQGQMENLSLHFNHETTAQWSDVKDMLKAQTASHEASLQILKEIKEYGIKCRKE